MAAVSTCLVANVLIVTIANPPVNALGAQVRGELFRIFNKDVSDPGISAIVIKGSGRLFSGGADIAEFGKPPLPPSLPAVCEAIEQCGKPVVAAIHGNALGGGLEVALACHYRVAARSARLGLPEVKLGLLPGAGGTQRLPRVTGAEFALGMIVSGEPVSAGAALDAGLIDAIADEAALEADAVAFARRAAGKVEHPVTSACSDRITGTDPALFDRFRKDNAKRFRGFTAPEACLRAVRAAVTLPFAEGIALERSLFVELVAGGQSQALRHNFFAERQAAKIEGLPAGKPLVPIERIGIVGAGTMGGGIAMCFLNAGLPVMLVETSQEALDRGVATIRKSFEASAAKGRIGSEAVAQAMALLRPSLDMSDLADRDLIIEAVFELMELKKTVFRQLDGIAKEGAILATNTSYLDVDEIAAETRRPDHVLGLHFFSPANVMKLLEVVRGEKTGAAVLATAMQLARRIGKIAVAAGVGHGFIGNRMLAARQNHANAIVLEGARPADVDRVLVEFGFPMGPFQMSDLAGLDIGWDPAKTSSSTIREVLCERGRRGQKAGKGFYDYDAQRQPRPCAEVDAIIAGFAARSGREQRAIGDDEIRERLLYPLVNEGAKILEEGIAQRAPDIDVVWLNGYGWPAWTGGPMFWASTVGLDKVLAGLERYAPEIDGLAISPLLREKAARNEGFDD